MSVIDLEKQRRLRDSISNSQSQSTQNTQSDTAGETLTDEDIEQISLVYAVLETCRQRPFTVKSNFARHMAVWIALAASEGLISTRINPEEFGNQWLLTQQGFEWMEMIHDVVRTRH